MNAPMHGISETAQRPSAVPRQQAQDQRLLHKCREFESLLYAAMLHTMRSTVMKSDLFHGGHAEDLYTSLLDDEYAKIMSDNAQHGIAEALYQQLKQPPATKTQGDKEKGSSETITVRAPRNGQGG